MKASGVPTDKPQWFWNAYVHGRPCRGGESGTGTSLGKAYFRTAWARIRAELTDADIATAHRYAEASAEALARYQNRQK